MARINALYDGQVTHVDHAVGRVLDTRDELGMANDTLVIFCSDHGEMLGDHAVIDSGRDAQRRVCLRGARRKHTVWASGGREHGPAERSRDAAGLRS